MGSEPRVVGLCGSTRFLDAFDRVGLAETLAGRVVLSIGSTHVGDDEALAGMSAFERADALAGLARLHRHKIEMADEVLVINVGGYVGESTRSEIEIAMGLGKPIRYLEPVER